MLEMKGENVRGRHDVCWRDREGTVVGFNLLTWHSDANLLDGRVIFLKLELFFRINVTELFSLGFFEIDLFLGHCEWKVRGRRGMEGERRG